MLGDDPGEVEVALRNRLSMERCRTRRDQIAHRDPEAMARTPPVLPAGSPLFDDADAPSAFEVAIGPPFDRRVEADVRPGAVAFDEVVGSRGAVAGRR